MAFNVTYHHLSDKNIRNLYGGLPQDIRLRVTSAFPKAITPTQRIKEQQIRLSPGEKFYQKRYFEYDEENDIRLPRAPAFKQLSRDHIDSMVARLSQPAVSKRRRRTSINESYQQCEARAPSAPPGRYPRYSGNLDSARSGFGSQKDMDDLTNRLLTPTVTSNIRNQMRCFRHLNVAEVKNACYKCAWTPSERFRREMSIITI